MAEIEKIRADGKNHKKVQVATKKRGKPGIQLDPRFWWTMASSLRGWLLRNRWPLRLSLLFGLPPLVFIWIHWLFGWPPDNNYYGPGAQLFCLPLDLLVKRLLGLEIIVACDHDPPTLHFAQNVVLLSANLLLWFGFFLLLANIFRRAVRHSGGSER